MHVSFPVFELPGSPGGQQKESPLTFQLHALLILGGLGLPVCLLFKEDAGGLDKPV